ncbi:DUF4429 domain-containing protein [Streptomonospora litoralis]|uniref:DUF4429 domain-containing protein n=1 Tax=Streptomonospora litoralis TaxID=2498135 RepID=A0A4P6Q7W3_9ACTN|nr:DUF4429 domain-containing protein [Streptomonospora litoralis]QBI55541.1 hypothetical protein EKD16_18890 [Streptomonospora litoralis]
MNDLHGDRATWRFDGETVLIRYHTGAFKNAMLKELGRCSVPVSAISAAEFDVFAGKRKRWALRLRLREKADPYAAVGAMLNARSQPFVLVGPASTELVAEYLAEQLHFAAQQADPPGGAPPVLATRLVPPLPLHIQTSEGTAAFDGSTVRLIWAGSEASSRKKKAHRREFALADITGVEWVPEDDWGNGHIRINTADATEEEITKPKHDLSCLMTKDGKQVARGLMMAATITAYLWAGKRPELD